MMSTAITTTGPAPRFSSQPAEFYRRQATKASVASGIRDWCRAERPRSPGLHQNGAVVSRRATSSREWWMKSGRAAAGIGSPGMNFSLSGFTYVPLCTMR